MVLHCHKKWKNQNVLSFPSCKHHFTSTLQNVPSPGFGVSAGTAGSNSFGLGITTCFSRLLAFSPTMALESKIIWIRSTLVKVNFVTDRNKLSFSWKSIAIMWVKRFEPLPSGWYRLRMPQLCEHQTFQYEIFRGSFYCCFLCSVAWAERTPFHPTGGREQIVMHLCCVRLCKEALRQQYIIDSVRYMGVQELHPVRHLKIWPLRWQWPLSIPQTASLFGPAQQNIPHHAELRGPKLVWSGLASVHDWMQFGCNCKSKENSSASAVGGQQYGANWYWKECMGAVVYKFLTILLHKCSVYSRTSQLKRGSESSSHQTKPSTIALV